MTKQICYIDLWYDDNQQPAPWYSGLELYDTATMTFTIVWKSKQCKTQQQALELGVQQAGLAGYSLALSDRVKLGIS